MGTVALIVDDCGYDLPLAKELIGMDAALTLSILPMAPYAKQTALAATGDGKEVMLHMPMEPIERKDPNMPPCEVVFGASEKEVVSALTEALKTVPGLSGVNNHEGSKACTDERAMRAVMKELKRLGLYFIDSKTTPDSVAYSVAKEVGVKSASRDVFLDNDDDVEAIKTEMKRLVSLSARLNGPVIGICHLRKKTVRALKEAIPEATSHGNKFVFASQVVK